DIGGAPGNRVLAWLAPRRPRDLSDLRVGPGDPVRLWRGSPDEPDAVRGVLSRRREGQLGIMIDGELPEALEAGRVHLDGEDPQATFERGARAIARFRAAPESSPLGRLRRIVAGELAPDSGRVPEWRPHDAELDEPQRAAVGAALAARDVALIHGPPGTGKTRVLVEVVRQLVARGERVLVAAASNAAVDHLAGQLAAHGVPVVRLGHPARVDPALEELTLDVQLERDGLTQLARGWLDRARELRRRAGRGTRAADRSALRAMRDEARALERDARSQLASAQEVVLARARVVAATCAGADAVALGDAVFDTTVLDEATQAADPIALVALARSPRAVLAGDPHQLPPTVLDLEAARRGLGVTAFERIATGASLLITQHRMHRDIMVFPSASKYGGLLRAAPAVAGHTLEDLGAAPDPLRPGALVFIDTAGTGWSEERGGDDPSTANPSMAARTAAEVRRLLSRRVAAREVAVISPYLAQVRLLRDALRAEVDGGLEIDTVDGFQGREKEAVVVDLVRSNDDGEIGFLADTRRMNVALTRARRFLLVVGDSATLAGHPYYAAFLAAVSQHGLHASAWSDDAPPV
ncbi:MAG TPA: AAA domain-containing protein, partial [Kofleriaceae bacterium]|nr:AAA domain-containing protein [Kofleriaceae bacterium]